MFLSLFLLTLFAQSINAYYISLNSLEWDQAKEYCQTHCNSDLATISNQQDYDTILQLINITLDDINFNNPPFFYIGLREIETDQWEWSDTSSFIFGNDISGGKGPWGDNQPSSGSCAALHKETYEWISSSCTNGKNDNNNNNYLYICNDCYGEINKNVFLDFTPSPFSSQESKCNSYFQTSLASYHSSRDINESALLQELQSEQNNPGWQNTQSFIGLNDDYTWIDGTTYDYGSNIVGSFPWKPNEPNNNVCFYMEDGLLIGEGSCVAQFAFCNAPSQICYQDRFTTTSGSFLWSTAPCQVKTDYPTIQNGIAIINNQRWYNNNHNLVIEYMFSMTLAATINGSAGLIFHFNTTCKHYLYIGVVLETQQLVANEVYNDIETELKSWNLNKAFLTDTFYLLRIELIDGKKFRISINNEQEAGNYNPAPIYGEFDMGNSGISPYIGIRNYRSKIIAKSLFISGDMIFETNPNPQQWFTQCITPTPQPTLPPVTANPITMTPTTSNPTSSTPTTNYPTTQIPTTSAPTTSAPTTSAPTTSAPTINTGNPSREPSISPTAKPIDSNQPTESPIFECDVSLSSASITIRFSYVINNDDANDNEILRAITNITDNAIKEQSSECDIPQFDRQIFVDNTQKMVNITLILCTVNCVTEELLAPFVEEIEGDLLNPTNAILTIKPNSTTTIITQIIHKESGIQTTQIVLNTINKAQENSSKQAPIGAIIGSIIGVLLICVIIVGIVVYRKKKRDKNFQIAAGKKLGRTIEFNKTSRIMSNSPSPSPLEGNGDMIKTGINNNNNNQQNNIIMTGTNNDDVFGEDMDFYDDDDGTDSIENKGTHSSKVSSNINIRKNTNGDIEMIIDNDDDTPNGDNVYDEIVIADEQDESTPNEDCNDEYKTNGGNSGESDQIFIEQEEINKIEKRKRKTHKDDTKELMEWLRNIIKLPQYYDYFVSNGYESLEFIKDIKSVDKLICIGIELKGHQTRLMAGIDRLRGDDIIAYPANYNNEEGGDGLIDDIDIDNVDNNDDEDDYDIINAVNTAGNFQQELMDINIGNDLLVNDVIEDMAQTPN